MAQLNMLHESWYCVLIECPLVWYTKTFIWFLNAKIVTFQLTSHINKTLRDFASENLPHDSISAKQMLQEHISSYKIVEELFTQTADHGKDALKAAGEEDSFGDQKEEIEKLIAVSHGKRDEWEGLWEAHRRRLQERVDICHFEQDINQVRTLFKQVAFYTNL